MKEKYDRYLDYLRNVRRVVVKAGTSSLSDESSKLDVGKIANLVSMIMREKRRGKAPILVSSGAIGAGVGRLELTKRPDSIEELQAAAAIGQGILMQTYEFFFNNYGQPIAQILLTNEDFTDPCRYRNLSKTLDTLIRWNVIPIINENDTIATEEIKVGDNDTLASYVTSGIKGESDGKLIKVVEEITPEVESWASKAGKGFGGMYTKVQAAKRLADKGIPTVIVNSGEPDVLHKVFTKQIGTVFLPSEV
jgi:glutamate 5-kinase